MLQCAVCFYHVLFFTSSFFQNCTFFFSFFAHSGNFRGGGGGGGIQRFATSRWNTYINCRNPRVKKKLNTTAIISKRIVADRSVTVPTSQTRSNAVPVTKPCAAPPSDAGSAPTGGSKTVAKLGTRRANNPIINPTTLDAIADK